MTYDYKSGKERIDEILKNKLDVIEREDKDIPCGNNFTFDNGYYGWVTAIFVDIRDSTTLFSNGDKQKVSKIIRSFTSEIIEILNNSDKLREIGIRGDCVYAIYTTPNKNDDCDIVNNATFINTFMKMLNISLKENNFPTIKVGIGMATAKELVVKAGRKGANINNNVWIGDAVTKAAKLSSLGNKKCDTIVLSSSIYDQIAETIEEKYHIKKDWLKKIDENEYGTYYHCSILDSEFNRWIEGGMKNE